MDATDVRELPGRIEELLDRLAAHDRAASECAEELVAAVVRLYGDGLSRLVGVLSEAPGGDALLRQLAEDDVVAGLLLLHGLHPDDVGTRIQRALDRVRPYLGSHAGGIDYLGVEGTDDGEGGLVARLRLLGGCDGCAGSAATVHDAVERAVLDAAPEVACVEVEGMVTAAKPALLQIGMRCPDGLAEAVNG